VNRILEAFGWVAANLRTDNPTDEQCCVFVRAVLARRFGEPVVGKASVKLWNLWPETGDAWGPVTATVQAGLGSVVDAPVGGAWHVVQVWTGAPFAPGSWGHTFLWYANADAAGTGFRFDSAAKRGADGGFVDGIEDGPAVALTEWAAVVKGRTFRLAVLGVAR
jgi:hypothetical protein